MRIVLRGKHSWAIASPVDGSIRNCSIYFEVIFPNNSARLPNHSGKQHLAEWPASWARCQQVGMNFVEIVGRVCTCGREKSRETTVVIEH